MKTSQMPPTTSPLALNRNAPSADHPRARAAAEPGGEAGGPGAVARHPPGDRARDPPAVEREAGDQVEDQQQQR